MSHPIIPASLPIFRESIGFEKIENYAIGVLASYLEPSDTMIHCSVSGFPIAALTQVEVDDLIRQACFDLRLPERYNPWDSTHTIEDLASDMETVLDHMRVMLIRMARPAPSLTHSNGSFAAAHATHERQLCILLNQLLFDGGMFRDKFLGLDDHELRVMGSIEVAEHVRFNYSSSESYETLWALLVELDAKYRIRNLKFTRKEREALDSHRKSAGAGDLHLGSLIAFATQLLKFRDENPNQGVELQPQRWSQEAFRSHAFNAAAERMEKSNILMTPTAKKNTHKAEPARGRGKPQSANRQMFSSLLAGAFGDLGKKQ